MKRNLLAEKTFNLIKLQAVGLFKAIIWSSAVAQQQQAQQYHWLPPRRREKSNNRSLCDGAFVYMQN